MNRGNEPICNLEDVESNQTRQRAAKAQKRHRPPTKEEYQRLPLVHALFSYVATESDFISADDMATLTRRLLDSNADMTQCPDGASQELVWAWQYAARQISGIGTPYIADLCEALNQAKKYAAGMKVQTNAVRTRE